MSPHRKLPERAGDLVESWPPGGLVVGLLPDPSDPEWAGRAALALAFAAADRRKPALILDLAPEGTNLASRFGAAEGAGIAELVEGDAELWEIVHRHAGGDAFYLPCGLAAAGVDLARSPAVISLAERVRSEGRIALVPLDRPGAGEAASAGWVDGFVRLGEKGVSSTRLSSDARVLGDLVPRSEDGTAETEASSRPPGNDPAGSGDRATLFLQDSAGSSPDRPGRDRRGSGVRMELRRRRSSSGVLRVLGRAGRALLAASLVIAAAVTASTWLGGPGWQEVREAAGTVAGGVGGAVPAGAGGSGPASDSDSASRSGGTGEGSSAADSVPTGPAAGDTGDTAVGEASSSG